MGHFSNQLITAYNSIQPGLTSKMWCGFKKPFQDMLLFYGKPSGKLYTWKKYYPGRSFFNPTCLLYGNGVKFHLHLLFNCPFATEVQFYGHGSYATSEQQLGLGCTTRKLSAIASSIRNFLRMEFWVAMYCLRRRTTKYMNFLINRIVLLFICTLTYFLFYVKHFS